MKAQVILVVMVLFLAAGCSGPKPEFYWYYPGKTLKEAKTDYAECECKAQEEAAKVVEDEYFDRLRAPTALEGGGKPSAKGSKSDDPAELAKADWGERYKQNAFAGCMQGRGYVKLKPGQVAPNLKTKELPLGAIAGSKSR